MVTSGCNFKIEAGTLVLMVSLFSILAIAEALFFPLASRIIFFALKMLRIPRDMALSGTSSLELKNLALSFMVDSLSLAILVWRDSSSPGSINAIWPFDPIPSI